MYKHPVHIMLVTSDDDTQAEPNVDRGKISATTSPLTSGRLTPQIAILLIIEWETK